MIWLYNFFLINIIHVAIWSFMDNMEDFVVSVVVMALPNLVSCSNPSNG